MRAGRTLTEILDELVEAGEITPDEAAERWLDAHADDERDHHA